MPVLRGSPRPKRSVERRQVVNAAQRKAVAYVASRSFFGIEIPVVLRNRSLVHGRAKVRRIGQVLGVSVVRKKTQPVRIAAAHVRVTSVVPALRRFLQQVDGADRKCLALNDGSGAAARQYGPGHKRQRLEGTPRSKRPGPRQSVIDQVRAL